MTEKERLRSANGIMMTCIDELCDYNFNRRMSEDCEKWSKRILTKIIQLQLTAEQCKRSLVNVMCCERI
jgi:hypothetical protein